jgi:hypothetical protein
MLSNDLRVVTRLKEMAKAGANVAEYPSQSESEEMINAYRRLREEARKLVERAGWSVEEFDDEMPDLPPRSSGGREQAFAIVSVEGPRSPHPAGALYVERHLTPDHGGGQAGPPLRV